MGEYSKYSTENGYFGLDTSFFYWLCIAVVKFLKTENKNKLYKRDRDHKHPDILHRNWNLIKKFSVFLWIDLIEWNESKTSSDFRSVEVSTLTLLPGEFLEL